MHDFNKLSLRTGSSARDRHHAWAMARFIAHACIEFRGFSTYDMLHISINHKCGKLEVLKKHKQLSFQFELL